MLEIDLTKYDLNTQAPLQEPERQYYFMAKAKDYVEKLAEELGRKPTCCVTTFGCPMVIVTQKCENPLFI